PVGGGGLIAGVATAIKAKRPDARIVAVEPTGAAKLPDSLHKGTIQTLSGVNTIADGLATRRVGELTFPIIRRHVHETATVDDDVIALATLLLLERAKTLVEGAGAAALAALISGKVKVEKGAVVCSGGNIDVTLLDQVIQRGLAQTGRAVRLRTVLDDRPGALRDLLATVAATGANVESIEHDRARGDVALGKAEVLLKLDTRGPDHVAQVIRALAEKGYRVARE